MWNVQDVGSFQEDKRQLLFFRQIGHKSLLAKVSHNPDWMKISSSYLLLRQAIWTEQTEGAQDARAPPTAATLQLIISRTVTMLVHNKLQQSPISAQTSSPTCCWQTVRSHLAPMRLIPAFPLIRVIPAVTEECQLAERTVRPLRGKRWTFMCFDRWSLRANFFSHTGHW